MNSTPINISLFEKVRQFLLFFLSMLMVLFIVGSIHFYSDYELRRSSIQDNERLTIELAEKVMAGDIARISSDILFLAEYISTNKINHRELQALFHSFANNRKIYDQIRYIDLSGKEQSRVNYRDGIATIVAPQLLQNKEGRYYVKEGIALRMGEIYLSEMDLNIDNGVIETPHKPVIRLVTPLSNKDGERSGIIVLNYLADELIQNFIQATGVRRRVTEIQEHTTEETRSQLHLLNSAGYWMVNDDPTKEWGFMFKDGETFEDKFSKEWEEMKKSDSGQITTPQGLFSYISFNPSKVALLKTGSLHPVQSSDIGAESWKIVSHLTTLQLESNPIGFIQHNRSLYNAILIFTIILSWILAYNNLHRKQYEMQRSNEIRFRDTLEEIHLAALTVDRHGEILFCNNYLLHLLHKRRSEVVGKNWITNFVPTDEKSITTQQMLKEQGDEIESNYFRTHIIDFRGEPRLIDWTSTVAMNEYNKIDSITCIGQDITEQSKTREELSKLARAATQSPAVIMITDIDGVIEYVNPKFSELTGYSKDEVVGENPRILKSGDTSKIEYIDLWKTIINGGEWRGVLHNKKKNGELYWESALISPIRNEEGKITHFLSVKEDITARKMLEDEVKSRKDELEQAHTLAAVGKMASMIAHDLRNPLSSIKMGLQILGKKNSVDSEESELHQIGLEQIIYMESILDGLLAYSRPDSLELSWNSLDKICDTAIISLQREIQSTKVEVTTNYFAGLPTLEIDKTKMRRAITNIISNAIHSAVEADPNNPQVTITTELIVNTDGSAVMLEVCDNGTGIERGSADQLFDPFVSTRSKGTGLGLAIVKRIINQHGGTITLQNRKLKDEEETTGACAKITVPLQNSGNERTII
jgi:PAS domain S-box-containing protein